MQISKHFYVNQKILRGLALVFYLSTITADFKTLGRERRHSPAALNEVLHDASYPWSPPLPPIPTSSLMHFLQTNNFRKEYFEHILILLFSQEVFTIYIKNLLLWYLKMGKSVLNNSSLK